VAGVTCLAALTTALIEADPLMVLPLVAAGFGMAFTMPAATAAVVEGAPDERAGIASGVVNAARQLGGAIGVALLGDVLGVAGGFVAGLHVALLMAAAAFSGGAVVTALFVRRPA
jgi:DHA2 family methylenomycin A resistance protein-like MFS transporter